MLIIDFMKSKFAIFVCGLVLLALASCSSRPLCPAYSFGEPTIEIPSEINS
jgi:hypothetical protein